MKVIWMDTETTGTDPMQHDIHQLAALMEIDGTVVGRINLNCQPRNWDSITDEAMEIGGVTREQLEEYDPPEVAYKRFVAFMAGHINRYNKKDKAYPGGFNVRFDTAFLRRFFEQAGDQYYGSWFNHRDLDPLPLVRLLNFHGIVDTENLKLGTVCEHYGVELGDSAHDALADVVATRDLFYKMTRKVGSGVMLLGSRKNKQPGGQQT